MLDLESVLKEWEEDSKIPMHQLDETSRSTPSLHAKYLQYLSLTKLQLKRAEHGQKTLLKDKFFYYEGKMSQEEIKDKKWTYDPFEGNMPTKAMKEKFYDADGDIQKSEERIEYYKVLISTLTEIVDSLKWRHQTIKNIIDWRRFESGG